MLPTLKHGAQGDCLWFVYYYYYTEQTPEPFKLSRRRLKSIFERHIFSIEINSSLYSKHINSYIYPFLCLKYILYLNTLNISINSFSNYFFPCQALLKIEDQNPHFPISIQIAVILEHLPLQNSVVIQVWNCIKNKQKWSLLFYNV